MSYGFSAGSSSDYAAPARVINPEDVDKLTPYTLSDPDDYRYIYKPEDTDQLLRFLAGDKQAESMFEDGERFNILIHGTHDFSALRPQGFSTAVNIVSQGLAMLRNPRNLPPDSKLPSPQNIREVLAKLAEDLIAPNKKNGRVIDHLEPLGIQLACNGFCKLIDEGNRKQAAIGRKAVGELIEPALQRLDGRSKSAYPMLINAFSKLVDDRQYGKQARKALAKLAGPALDHLAAYSKTELPMMINGLAKVADDPKHRKQVSKTIAALSRPALRYVNDYDQHGYAMLINGLSKLTEDPTYGKQAMQDIVDLAGPALRYANSYERRAYAMLVNGFAKLTHDKEHGKQARRDIAALIEPALQYVDSYEKQQYPMLVNGFSKLVDDDEYDKQARIALAMLIPTSLQYIDLYERQQCPVLINGFSKLVDDEEHGEDARQAIVKLANRALKSPDKYEKQHYPMLINGLSKLAEDEKHGKQASDDIARLIEPALKYVNSYEPQHYPTLINGLSKLTEHPRHGKQARKAIFKLIAPALKQHYGDDKQTYPVLINGLSKLADDPDYGNRARQAIATLCTAALKHPEKYEKQHFPMLINGLSKLAEDKTHGKQARQAIARLAKPALRFAKDYDPQAYPMLVNGFAKLTEDEKHKEQAMHAIAQLVGPTLQHDYGKDKQAYPMLINGFAKLIEHPDHGKEAGKAIAALIEPALEHAHDYDRKQYAMLILGFSKLAEHPDHGKEAGKAIATLIDPALKYADSYDKRAYPMLINGLSKIVGDSTHGKKARAAMATLCAPALNLTYDDDRSAYVVLINGFSRMVEDPEHGRQAKEAIATLCGPALQRVNNYDKRHYAMLVNGLEKLAVDPQHEILFQSSLTFLADRVVDASPSFDIRQCAMIANGYGWMPEDVRSEAPARRVMTSIVATLEANPNLIQRADPRQIGMLMSALDRVDMLEELARLSPAFLNRLENCLQENGLRDSNLETVANLVSGLRPCIATATVQEHRRRALHLLNEGLRPVIDRKIAAYLSDTPEAGDEACSMRKPAYSCYQILKTYADAVARWSNKNLSGMPHRELKLQQKAMSDWLLQFRRQSDKIADQDVSASSWNLIARLDAMESGDPASILDNFIGNYQDSLRQKRSELEAEVASNPAAASESTLRTLEDLRRITTPAHFDFNAVFAEMDHAPAPPPPGVGKTPVTFHSFNGQPLEIEGLTSKELAYTIWGRLSQQKLPLREVTLPGQLSQYMLGKIIYIDGIPHRLDTFGGSKMKGGRVELGQFIQEGLEQGRQAHEKGEKGEKDHQDKTAPRRQDNGKLIAIPLADTFPGTDLEKLMSALLTNEEAFFYFQRLMIASPPDLKGVDIPPGGHVLEGRFKLGVLPDRPSGEKHPFQIDDLQLHPHDGCGFIKESVARQLGWLDQVRHCEPYAGTQPTANLAVQGLQHYPRNAPAAEEIGAPLKSKVQGAKLSHTGVYRGLTTGLQTGHMGVTVPMVDKVSVPPQKSSLIDPDDPGLLAGRSPFDKPNFRDISMDKVGTADKGDPDAVFLGKAIGFQYGLVGKYADETMPDGSPKLMGAKGLQVVIPDDMWPKDYADQDIVLSNQDPKVQSDWIDSKQRATEDQLRDFIGALVVTDIFPPGSLVGMPKDEQKKLDGDFDGDTMLMLATHMRNFFEHVRQENLDLEAMWAKLNGDMPQVSAKPVKTHTSAFTKDGRYRWGRAAFIMATKLMVLENFISLQQAYLARPKEIQAELARRACFAVYEGWDPSVRKSIHALLEEDDDPALLQPRLDTLLEQLTQDYRDATHHATREAIVGLWDDLRQWADEQGVAMKRSLPAKGLVPLTDTAGLDVLKPGIRDKVKTYSTPALRLEAWADMGPGRLLEKNPASYYPSDLKATARRLFTEGIKKGTDAYKAPKAVREYAMVAKRLRHVFSDMQVYGAPYTKHLARKIAAGQVSVEGYLALMEDIPNLAGEVGELTAPVLGAHDYLPQTEEALRATLPASRRSGLEERTFDLPKRSPILPHLNAHVMPLMQHAHRLQPEVTSLLSDVAAKAGGREVNAKDRLKSDFALKEKIWRISQANQSPPEQAAAAVKDTLRYSIELDEVNYWKGVEDWIAGMREKGVEISDEDIHDTFYEGSDYKGVNVAFRYTAPASSSNAGQKLTAEIQFHTPASYAAKKENHKVYKEMQRTDDAAQREAMQAVMQARCDTVRVPVRKQRTASNAAVTAGSSRQADKTPAKPPTHFPYPTHIRETLHHPQAPAAQGSAQAPFAMAGRSGQSFAGAPGKRPVQQPMEVRDIRRGRPSVSSVPTAPSGRTGTELHAAHTAADRARVDQSVNRITTAARGIEPFVTTVVEQIFAYINATQPPEEALSRFKTEEAIRQKIERNLHLPFEQALAKVNDGLRYARVLDQDFFVQQTKFLFTELAKAGMEVTEVRNTFTPDSPYKAIHLSVAYQNGATRSTFEIQLHTQDSYEVKREIREDYERLRDGRDLTQQERRDINARRRAASARITQPPGIEQISLQMAQEAAQAYAATRPGRFVGTRIPREPGRQQPLMPYPQQTPVAGSFNPAMSPMTPLAPHNFGPQRNPEAFRRGPPAAGTFESWQAHPQQGGPQSWQPHSQQTFGGRPFNPSTDPRAFHTGQSASTMGAPSPYAPPPADRRWSNPPPQGTGGRSNRPAWMAPDTPQERDNRPENGPGQAQQPPGFGRRWQGR